MGKAWRKEHEVAGPTVSTVKSDNAGEHSTLSFPFHSALVVNLWDGAAPSFRGSFHLTKSRNPFPQRFVFSAIPDAIKLRVSPNHFRGQEVPGLFLFLPFSFFVFSIY